MRLLIFLLTIGTLFAAEIPERKIDVVLGIDKIDKLDFTPHTKIQVGNESVLTYELIPQKREITLKGVKPGKTSIIIRDTVGDIKARYLVTVTSNSLSKDVVKLKEFLGEVEGLEIGIKGEQIFVGGKIVNVDDIGTVVTVLEKFPDIIHLYDLSPHTQRYVAQKMQDEIQANDMKNVTVRIVNKRFWIEGIVDSAGKKKRAYDIAAAYLPDKIATLSERTGAIQKVKGGPGIIQNFVNVNEKKQKAPEEKMLKITAQFVELVKDYNKVFGFSWTPVLGGTGGEVNFGKTVTDGVVSKSNNTLSGTISNLFPKLASAKSAGHARVIQSGVVLVKDKVTAKLKKTSKKPFALGTGEFTKGESAETGFSMQVTPSVVDQERVELNIGVDVSASSGSNPPETFTNNIVTKLIVKTKESAVIGGVVVKNEATAYDKDPPYGKTEVEDGTGNPIFEFLKSKSYINTRSQFVVFVTPEIIDSASEGTEEIKKKFKQRKR